jgi:hypothetical protein
VYIKSDYILVDSIYEYIYDIVIYNIYFMPN